MKVSEEVALTELAHFACTEYPMRDLEVRGQQDPICETDLEDWAAVPCLHDLTRCSKRMRTKGSKDDKMLKRTTGQRRAGNAAFGQHGHLGLSSERVGMGLSQAG